VLCHQDLDAEWLLRTCARLGLEVPGQVQVLGIDDNAHVCLTTKPTLSSLVAPALEMGAAAALHLHRLLSDAPPPESPVLIAPVRIAVRGSTAAAVGLDPLVARCDALFARHPRWSLARLARELGLSQATVQRRHRAACGQSVHQRRQARRLAAVRNLIVQGDPRPLAVIAKASGYPSYANFHAIFVKAYGAPPSSCRRG
jgi:AraC-like DNA-binding protein